MLLLCLCYVCIDKRHTAFVRKSHLVKRSIIVKLLLNEASAVDYRNKIHVRVYEHGCLWLSVFIYNTLTPGLTSLLC